MNWQDKAIVISSRKFGEKSMIIKVLSRDNGAYSGVIKNAQSKSVRGNYQAGNLLFISWKARLPEHLGFFTGELLEAPASNFFNDNVRLHALLSACSLVDKIIVERDPQPAVFNDLQQFINALSSQDEWQCEYINFELKLLANQGFGLDLTKCAATETSKNLKYISPKTGRAISAEVGEQYKDKLFLLPEFLINRQPNRLDSAEILDGLKISGYFLNKFILAVNNRKMPEVRGRLIDLLREKTDVIIEQNS